MVEYHILGHSNAGLSMIIDTLFSIYKNKMSIKVISNMPIAETKTNLTPYKISSIEIEELLHTNWKRKPEAKLIISTGITKTKKIIFDFFKSNYNLTAKDYSTLIHPSTTISKSTIIESGTVIMPGVIIAPFTNLGNFVFINRNSSIGHHTLIGNFANINPGVTICGKIKIGNNVTIGAGATIIDNLEIGENTIIGAGSVVTKSIPPNVVAYGCPAKVVKYISKINII